MSSFASLDYTWSQLSSQGVDVTNYCGMWCVEPSRFSQLLWQVQSMDLSAHIQANRSRSIDLQQRDYLTVGNDGHIAVVNIEGAMTKKGSSMSEMGSTIRARRAIQQAANDKTIDQIILVIDSPGGTVSGTADLARTVTQAGLKKPVTAYVEDLAASAAYWIASQCNAIYANAGTAQVGSIGTFLDLYDLSGMAEKEGVKPVVIKAGEFKAGGFPGTEISDAQIAEWQKMIDATQAQFSAAIASGRKMSLEQVNSVATGLTYMADDAVSLGLIDGLRNFEELLQELQSTPQQRRRVAMSESPATYTEIVQSCHGIDASQPEDSMFITDCLSKGLTATAASTAWAETLIHRASAAREELAAAQQQAGELQTKLTELESSASKKKVGVPAVGTLPSDPKQAASDPLEAWNTAIAAKVASGMDRSKAVLAVNREQPELRQSLIAASN